MSWFARVIVWAVVVALAFVVATLGYFTVRGLVYAVAGR